MKAIACAFGSWAINSQIGCTSRQRTQVQDWGRSCCQTQRRRFGIELKIWGLQVWSAGHIDRVQGFGHKCGRRDCCCQTPSVGLPLRQGCRTLHRSHCSHRRCQGPESPIQVLHQVLLPPSVECRYVAVAQTLWLCSLAHRHQGLESHFRLPARAARAQRRAPPSGAGQPECRRHQAPAKQQHYYCEQVHRGQNSRSHTKASSSHFGCCMPLAPACLAGVQLGCVLPLTTLEPACFARA